MPEVDDPDDVDVVAAALANHTDLDRQRHTPPADLWSSIESIIAPTPIRRHRRPMVWLAGAAAVLALAVVGVRLAATDHERTSLVAQAELTNDGLDPAGRNSSGVARIERRSAGLDLDLSLRTAPTPPAGYLEIWLIDANVDKMVSLGPFHGNGRYPIPAGYDPAGYPIVDISIEPPDGKPTHSSVSALRGRLTSGA